MCRRRLAPLSKKRIGRLRLSAATHGARPLAIEPGKPLQAFQVVAQRVQAGSIQLVNMAPPLDPSLDQIGPAIRPPAPVRWPGATGPGRAGMASVSSAPDGSPPRPGAAAQSIDDPPPGVTLESGQHTNEQSQGIVLPMVSRCLPKRLRPSAGDLPGCRGGWDPLRKKLCPLERPSPHPNQQRQPLRRTASFLATAGPGTSASRTPRLVPRRRRARAYFVLPWRENPGLMLPEFAPST